MCALKGQPIMHYNINSISKPAVKLLKSMITMEPENRINFEQLFNDEVMSDKHKAEVDAQIPEDKKVITQEQIDRGHEEFLKQRAECMKWLHE